MQRRRALLSLFSLAIGGSASCRAGIASPSVFELSLKSAIAQRIDGNKSDREFVRASLLLADELKQRRMMIPAADSRHVTECLDEVSLLCDRVLNTGLASTTPSPAIWQACADSCRRCGSLFPATVRKVFEKSADACLRIGFPTGSV